MKLMELFAGMPARLPADAGVDIGGIAHDSRRVERGDLFVAVVGERFDGRVFAAEAVERGAAAVLARGEAPPDLAVPWIEADAPRTLLGPLAARLYDHPDRRLTTVGVTGTNGKSTVVALVAELLERAGRPCGRIGTLGARYRDYAFAAERTTPEASDLFRVLAEMGSRGAEAVAMEVSSHALDLGRVAEMAFDVAVFTNLTRDHLDFHGDFDGYFAAKRKLFGLLREGGAAVVNVGDPYGRRLAAELPGCVTFGDGGDVVVADADFGLAGTEAVLRGPWGELSIETPLLGRFNLDNALAAAGVAAALGIEPAVVRATLAAVRPLPGRMEPVDRGQPFLALVDYAHTDAALDAALAAAREIAGDGRVIVVFGCGGDRDPGKRALMGRVAGRRADHAVATSDNPRGEDPALILAAVEEGLRQAGGGAAWEVEPDRRRAIARAVELATAGDVVVVAGKGHEEVQIIGDRTVPFSDRDELAAALEARRDGSDRA